MTTRTLILSVIGLAIAVVVILMVAQPGARQFGGKTIDFSLQDVEGNTVSLADYRGQVVLVDVWATWCGYCVEEIPDLIAMQEQADAEESGLQIIGIAVDDDTRVVDEFVNERDFNYPIVYGDNAEMKGLGNVSGYPTKFIINRDGVIVETIIGARSADDLTRIIEKHL